MLTDLDLATLCWSCYNDTNTFDRIVFTSGVWAGIKHYPDCSAIAFRGSTTIEDWLRDFQGTMVDDPALGRIEQGFLSGMRDVAAHLVDEIPKLPKSKTLYITGHSLGAARAFILAGLICAAGSGLAINSVVTFGPPRPGDARLKHILAPVDIRAYKNGNDPVCDVPVMLPLFPYIAPRALLPVNVAPAADDPWGLLAHHHIELYIQAMKGLTSG